MWRFSLVLLLSVTAPTAAHGRDLATGFRDLPIQCVSDFHALSADLCNRLRSAVFEGPVSVQATEVGRFPLGCEAVNGFLEEQNRIARAANRHLTSQPRRSIYRTLDANTLAHIRHRAVLRTLPVEQPRVSVKLAIHIRNPQVSLPYQLNLIVTSRRRAFVVRDHSGPQVAAGVLLRPLSDRVTVQFTLSTLDVCKNSALHFWIKDRTGRVALATSVDWLNVRDLLDKLPQYGATR